MQVKRHAGKATDVVKSSKVNALQSNTTNNLPFYRNIPSYFQMNELIPQL